MPGSSVCDPPARSRAGWSIRNVVPDEFLGGEPDIQITIGRPHLFLPEVIRALLDIVLGRIEGQYVRWVRSLHGVRKILYPLASIYALHRLALATHLLRSAQNVRAFRQGLPSNLYVILA
jgi:hypothetical protein